MAEAALESGAAVEVAVALALLHQRLSQGAFARRTAHLIRAGIPGALRRQLLALLAMRREDGPSRVELIDALRRIPNFAAATLESLASLAEAARTEPLAGAWSGATASGERFWIAHDDIRAAAARHPDLALVMLRVQDGRSHAA